MSVHFACSPDEPAPGTLDVQWIHGSVSPKHNTDPDIQIHFYNEHTVILRQNMAVHHEAPFMFLLFGDSRCILLDTGATKSPSYFPLRATVDQLIDEWWQKHKGHHHDSETGNPLPYELVVAHTHLHRDHFEGDAQFDGRPNTLVVGKSLSETIQFYGFQNWPRDDNIQYDLGGGRSLRILATPGHEDAEISIYDPCTHLLFSGDLVYLGRLYVNDWTAFSESIQRLVSFCRQHPVRYLLGCHIEMSKFAGHDYLVRSTYQPYERALAMSVDQLHEIGAAVQEIDGKPGVFVYDAFIIYNQVPDRYFSYDCGNLDAEPGDVCLECVKERTSSSSSS